MIKEEKIYEHLKIKCRRQQSSINYINKNFYIQDIINKKRNNSFLKKNKKKIDDFIKFNCNKEKESKKEIISNDTSFEINSSEKTQENSIKENNNNFRDISSFSLNNIDSKEKIIDSNIINESNDFRLIGFKNIGNSCYMNSLLQILLRTPCFLKNLRDYQNSPNYQPNTLIDTLIELSEGQNQIALLKKIKMEMSEVDYSYGQKVQKDSQKFGIDLIEQIIVIMKGETSSSDSDENYEYENEETGEIKYFNFLKNSKSGLTCLEKMFLFNESFMKFGINKMPKIGFENWLSINLTFPNNNGIYSIEDLLSMKYKKLKNSFLSENFKNIEDINKYINFNENLNFDDKNIDEKEKDDYSDIFQNYSFFEYIRIRFNQFCNMVKEGWNKLFSNENKDNKIANPSFKQLAFLPNTLIISINRAILGQHFHFNKLKFGKYLNLNDYLDKVIFQNDSSSGLYKLYAVNECFSLKGNLGHNISYVEKEEDLWVKFDDQRLSYETPSFNGNRFVIGLYYIRKK